MRVSFPEEECHLLRIARFAFPTADDLQSPGLLPLEADFELHVAPLEIGRYQCDDPAPEGGQRQDRVGQVVGHIAA